MAWLSTAGQGLPVGEAATTTYLSLVRFLPSPAWPHSHWAESQTDQGERLQSTGHSRLQTVLESPGAGPGRWEQREGDTGRPSLLTQRRPRVCRPGPHSDSPEGRQEVQSVRLCL